MPVQKSQGASPVKIKLVDPRSLVENPDRVRRTKSSPQFDALLLTTIKAVGIVKRPWWRHRSRATTAVSSTPAIVA